MPSGSGCGLPACLPLWREGPIRQPACFPLMLVNLLFCELTSRHSEAVRTFHRKTFSFFGLSGEPADRVPILHLLPQIVLRAFKPGPYLKHGLCIPHLPVQPPLAGGRRVSGLLLHWQVWLGTYSAGFLFFSQVCRPLRFQSFPQTHL